MSDLSDQVRDMYTRYPFPSKDRESNELPGYLPAFMKRWFTRKTRHMAGIGEVVAKLLEKREGKQRVLDAGCGTGEILSHVAGRVTDADVYALDLTPASLEKARALIQREGLKVEFLEHDLMKPLPFEQDPFDVIVSIGVLMCVSEPVVAFENLRKCLTPDGTLLCYLYGSLGRWDLTLKQEVVALLGKQGDFEDKIKLVETLGLYPRRHDAPVKEFLYSMFGFDRDTTRKVWIVDQLCHVLERCYVVSEIQAILDEAGYELIEFHGFPNKPEDFFEDPELIGRANEMPKAEQYRIFELLLRPTGYLFTARARA